MYDIIHLIPFIPPAISIILLNPSGLCNTLNVCIAAEHIAYPQQKKFPPRPVKEQQSQQGSAPWSSWGWHNQQEAQQQAENQPPFRPQRFIQQTPQQMFWHIDDDAFFEFKMFSVMVSFLWSIYSEKITMEKGSMKINDRSSTVGDWIQDEKGVKNIYF